MHLHPENYGFENFKGMVHTVMFLIVLFKIHVIDKKLSLLERNVTHK